MVKPVSTRDRVKDLVIIVEAIFNRLDHLWEKSNDEFDADEQEYAWIKRTLRQLQEA